MSSLFTFRCWPLPGPVVVDQLMTFLSSSTLLSSGELLFSFSSIWRPPQRRLRRLRPQLGRESARAQVTATQQEGVTPAFSPWPCSGPRDHMSQASSVVDLAWFSGIQRLLQRDDGVHSAHHCALSAAARGQGRCQRNFEFPEAVIFVNWKKSMAFYTLFEKSNLYQKIQFWQNFTIFSGNQSCQELKSANPQHFHEFFTPKFFWQFSREIKVVNS